MRPILAIALVFLFGFDCALACGDKLLFLGRGVSFARIHMAEKPASILIYMNESSQLPAADKDVQFQTVLRIAGHRPKSVANRTEFEQALTSGSYNVIIVGMSDAETLKAEIEGAPGRPLLIPMLYKPKKEQFAAAQQQFSCAVKAEKNNRILRVLEDAMKGESKATGPVCRIP
jgi:hypothetical protein